MEAMNIFEVIINGETRLATENRGQAEAMFDFYRAEKQLFNIKEIILMNAALREFVEG